MGKIYAFQRNFFYSRFSQGKIKRQTRPKLVAVSNLAKNKNKFKKKKRQICIQLIYSLKFIIFLWDFWCEIHYGKTFFYGIAYIGNSIWQNLLNLFYDPNDYI